MNNAKSLTRVIALMLLVVMTMSMVSCDVNSIIESVMGHTHSFVNGECACGETDPDYVCEHSFVNGACIYCGEKKEEVKPDDSQGGNEGGNEGGEQGGNQDGNKEYQTITIAEALEIAAQYPNGAPELYYINATVKSMVNAGYGEMYIEDETGEIYVFGTRGEDGTTYPDKLPAFPVKGDKVVLLCELNQHKGQNQVHIARLISFEHIPVDPSDLTDYEEMTVAAARDAEAGKKVIVSGVVAQITYANGMAADGVILVDGTSSIYVYSRDLAGQVSIGNTVEIAAEKTYYVLASEQNNANKFGYLGCNQLDNAIVISNDKGNTDFDKSWITETTVKDIMEIPVTEDITTKIFKVNALVKKVPGSDFVNYYFDDIDGVTGSYAYTKCSGGDFAWLDQFDGKICTVYLVAINAKSNSTGCFWRFIPVAVSDDGYTFDLNKTAEYAVEYHGMGQFLNKYTGDPALEMIGSVSSELLGIENATLTYSSSDENVVYFATEDGKIIMHCKNTGTATVTVSCTFNGITHSNTVEITVEGNQEFDTISIADAVAKGLEEEVIIRGIVGPSLVNQAGFYLFDESGMIAIRVNDAEIFKTIAIGNEVVIKGKRSMWHGTGKDFGQIVISDATVEANYYGNHDYLTVTPITDKTVTDFYNLDELDMSETTKVYHLTATIVFKGDDYSSTVHVSDGTSEVRLYTSSANQYNWLKTYVGQTVTVEIVPCNWNSKNYYTGCVTAIILEDGTKILNTLNWN